MSSYPAARPNNGTEFTKIRHNDTYPAIDPATKSDHTGHYVFITGASKGVGRATAIAFAQAGAAGIAIGARSDLSTLENEIASASTAAGKKSPLVLKLKLDVTDENDTVNAAKEVEKVFGKLDILINNAGYLDAWEPIADTKTDVYWQNYEINIKGVYLVSKALLPLMLKGGEKTIVNLSSRGAHSLTKGGSGYQNTKFAVIRFAEHLMADYADQGLLAYSVHPCGFATELGKNMPESLHFVFTDTLQIASDTMCFLTAQRREWLGGRYIDCCWDMPEFLSRETEIVDGDKLKFRMIF